MYGETTQGLKWPLGHFDLPRCSKSWGACPGIRALAKINFMDYPCLYFLRSHCIPHTKTHHLVLGLLVKPTECDNTIDKTMRWTDVLNPIASCKGQKVNLLVISSAWEWREFIWDHVSAAIYRVTVHRECITFVCKGKDRVGNIARQDVLLNKLLW